MSGSLVMNDREVWLKAAAIVAGYGDDDGEHFGNRLMDTIGETAPPEDWRRVAAAVDSILAASRQ